MIELIPNLPDPVLGIRAEGKVTSSDYISVFVPAVKEKLSKNAKISLLYHLVEDFDNYGLAAIWEDIKMGIQHYTAWEKVAIITDVGWVGNMSIFFGYIIPLHILIILTFIDSMFSTCFLGFSILIITISLKMLKFSSRETKTYRD